MRSGEARERQGPEPTPAHEPGQGAAALAPGAAAVLRLQRTAGNQAVAAMLARRGRPATLARAIARCGCRGTCTCAHHEEEAEERRPNPLAAAVLQRSSSSASSGGSSGGSGSSQPGGSSGAGGSSGSSGGAGGGAAPAPSGPANPANCRVDVRATHIGGILSGAPVWHTLIVHTDASGSQTGWRGGPGGGGGGGFGNIVGTTGAYAPGFIDYDTSSPSVTVGSGPAVCGATTCFASELARIDATATPYNPTGPNSNTWVKTVLSNCGLTVAKPVWIAPGFSDPNL